MHNNNKNNNTNNQQFSTISRNGNYNNVAVEALNVAVTVRRCLFSSSFLAKKIELLAISTIRLSSSFFSSFFEINKYSIYAMQANEL